MNAPATATPADVPRLQNALAQVHGVVCVIAQAHNANPEDHANALWAARALLEECRAIAGRLPGIEADTPKPGKERHYHLHDHGEGAGEFSQF